MLSQSSCVMCVYKYSLGPIAYKNIFFIDSIQQFLCLFFCSFIAIKKLFAVNNHNDDNENYAHMSMGICVNILNTRHYSNIFIDNNWNWHRFTICSLHNMQKIMYINCECCIQ